jgi:rhodanese-related sulfurtransferase
LASVKPVSPAETQELLQHGAVYVDVRSEPEYEAGHVPGSLNVPLMHLGPGGMVPNPEFLEVMQSAFGKAEKLVMGCRSGNRSQRAAEMLIGAGYSDVSNLTTGFEATRDAFGRTLAGWKNLGLPVESGKPAGQAYTDVKTRAPK